MNPGDITEHLWWHPRYYSMTWSNCGKFLWLLLLLRETINTFLSCLFIVNKVIWWSTSTQSDYIAWKVGLVSRVQVSSSHVNLTFFPYLLTQWNFPVFPEEYYKNRSVSRIFADPAQISSWCSFSFDSVMKCENETDSHPAVISLWRLEQRPNRDWTEREILSQGFSSLLSSCLILEYVSSLLCTPDLMLHKMLKALS